MQCRTCGTEIADKAIVCYRCGASTTDPVRRPAPAGGRPSPLLSFVAAALLALIALYLGEASRTASNPGTLQLTAGILAAVAVLLLLVRMLRRR